jgi:phage shock protein C
MARKRFTLDRNNKMLFGVCAGLGRYLGIDPTFIRIGMVAITIMGAFPWTLVAYGVAAVLAKPKGRWVEDAEDAPGGRFSTNDLRLNERDIDRRIAEVDAYVGSNDRLAREIETLRDSRGA